MAQSIASYSRVVAWLKILFPLSALILLSTLFLFSRSIDPEQSIPFADVDVRELAREPRITAPEFSGMTADGAAISIAAATAKTDPTNLEDATIDRLEARIETPDGQNVVALADQGAIENARIARLTGNVVVTSSAGYRISTDELISDLDTTRIESAGPVVATGPIGEVQAGRMSVTLRGQTGQSVLVFKNRIRVVYDPTKQE